MRRLSIIILLFFCNLANAVVLNNLYSIELSVADDMPSSRQEVLPLALEQLLLKVSSNKAVLQNPALLEAKQHVDKFINSYSYTQLSEGYKLNIQFNEKMINNLLHSCGRNTLSKNRPVVLVWLHTNEPHEEIQEKLDILSKTYGVPLIVPKISLPDIDLREGQIRELAKRHRADLILKAKINNTENEKLCEWQILDNKADNAWNDSGASIDAQLESMLNNLADRLIARYNHKVATKSTGEILVTLKVQGLNNLQSYAKVSAYLKGLAPVKKVELRSADDNEATFVLSTDGDKQAIITALSMDRLLTSKPESFDDEVILCSYP